MRLKHRPPDSTPRLCLPRVWSALSTIPDVSPELLDFHFFIRPILDLFAELIREFHTIVRIARINYEIIQEPCKKVLGKLFQAMISSILFFYRVLLFRLCNVLQGENLHQVYYKISPYGRSNSIFIKQFNKS